MQTKQQAIQRQNDYITRVEDEGFDFGLTVAGAFVRSIRSLGYRSAATALDELIDNSIEAGAENVHIVFGYDASSDKKPVSIAVIDDGFGMVPKMVRASVVWGGTDREGSRNLFGRYGYGLPSASVSQGKRFSVKSRTDDSAFYGVVMDVDDISEGRYLVDGRVVVPEPSEVKLPEYVTKYAEKSFPGGVAALRTVVEWDRFDDQLTWKTTKVLEEKLREHIGLVYRNFLRQTTIKVNGKSIEAIDPLFITPGYRFYDIDIDVAEALSPLEFAVRDAEGDDQIVRMRFSLMPPTFFSIDKQKVAFGGNANPRLIVRRENLGIVVCRNGRQIDSVTRNPLTTFQTYDRNIGIELDFPAALDEEFGITTAKQQITLSDRVWDILKERGFLRILGEMRARNKEARDDVDQQLDAPGELPRDSEVVMEEAQSLLRRRPQSEEVQSLAEENLAREVDRIAEESGLNRELIEVEKSQEFTVHPYKVETESLPGAPFFRVEPRGGQLTLMLNRSHRFFTDVYSAVGGTEGRRLRAGLELLLFAIGECELDAPNAVKVMYGSEKIEWSNRLSLLLGLLEERVDLISESTDDSIV